jgi:hypothetical protein
MTPKHLLRRKLHGVIHFYGWDDDFMRAHDVRTGFRELKSGLTSIMKIYLYSPADEGYVNIAEVEKMVLVNQEDAT